MSEASAEPVFKRRGGKRPLARRKNVEEDKEEEGERVVIVDSAANKKKAGLTAGTRSAQTSDERASTVGVVDSNREIVPHQYGGGADAENEEEKGTKKTGNKYTGTQGPIKAPAFIRSTIRVEYQPDICKDYRDTGYCGYGDQCKFLHDRGDYKAGWQIEKEWEEVQAKKRKRLAEGLPEEDEEDNKYAIEEEDDLPFACFICRGDFSNPVVTQCGHYFCGQCALDWHKKNPKCAVCAKQTFGIFNRANKLISKLKQRDREAAEETLDDLLQT